MRLLHVFFVFITLHGFSQVQKVVIRKEKTKPSLVQSEAPWSATFCHLYNGTIKLSDLYNKKNKIEINHNTIGLKIYTYEIIYRSRGKIISETYAQGDSISYATRQRLLLIDKNSKLFISSIKAISKYQDTLLLNSIELKVVD